jgi:drug/metabolite transporter (DMT)-like permease
VTARSSFAPRAVFAVPVVPYAAVALAACAWGTWALIIRHAEAICPMPSALEATLVMAVLTAVTGLTSLRDRIPGRAPVQARAWVAYLGFADAMNVLLLFAAYKITVGVAVLTHYLTPILVAVASPALLGERLTRRTTLAVIVSISGLALMVAPAHGTVRMDAVWRSAALGAGSALFYASNIIVNKFVAESFSTSETMFWHGIVATPFLAAFVPRAAWAALDVRAAAFLSVVSIGPGALAGLVFVWALRRMPAAHASTLTLIEPLVAVLVGASLYGEDLGFRTVVGGGCILAGAFAVMIPARRPPDERLSARGGDEPS